MSHSIKLVGLGKVQMSSPGFDLFQQQTYKHGYPAVSGFHSGCEDGTTW